ncbi:MAG: phosphoribosylglycinamide formyltransferase [Pseudomonadota bacterium]
MTGATGGALPRIGILISGGGSNMAALVAAMQSGAVPATPALVIADRAEAGGIARGQALGVPVTTLAFRGFPDRAAFETALDAALRAARVDLVCLAGFMRILSPGFVAGWQGRMLNIHPSLLPLFPGLNTHARVLEAGMAVHGATVHQVTADLDAGPILGQAVIAVRAGDTADRLAARLLPMEHRLYPAALAHLLRGGVDPIALLEAGCGQVQA